MEAKKQKRKQSEKLQNDDKFFEMILNVAEEVSSWPKWLQNNAETLFTDSYNSNELLSKKKIATSEMKLNKKRELYDN